jgi:hypothetical protein
MLRVRNSYIQFIFYFVWKTLPRNENHPHTTQMSFIYSQNFPIQQTISCCASTRKREITTKEKVLLGFLCCYVRWSSHAISTYFSLFIRLSISHFRWCLYNFLFFLFNLTQNWYLIYFHPHFVSERSFFHPLDFI